MRQSQNLSWSQGSDIKQAELSQEHASDVTHSVILSENAERQEQQHQTFTQNESNQMKKTQTDQNSDQDYIGWNN